MKKTIFALILIAFASTAYAETSFTSAGNVVGAGGGTFKTSTNVTLKAIATGTSYCAAAQHASSTPANGGKQWATLSNDAVIKSAAAVDTGPTSCASATELPTGTWQ